MDPVSITTGVFTLIQAAYTVLAICYKLRSLGAPPLITEVATEVRDLSEVLERLERHSETTGPRSWKPVGSDVDVGAICDSGPLVTCLAELNRLEAKLSAVAESRRKAAMMAIGLGQVEKEIQDSLSRLQRCKSSLSLALSADHAAMLKILAETTVGLADGVETSVARIGELSRDLHRDKQDHEFAAMLRWLSPLDPTESHERAKKARLAGTCEWLLRNIHVAKWLDGETAPMLWLTGPPGTGKTTLFSILVDTLSNSPREQISDNRCQLMAYFYCDFRQTEHQSLLNVLGCLAAQLLAAEGPGQYSAVVAQHYRQAQARTSGTSPSEEMLTGVIGLLAVDKSVVIMIDALDESSTKLPLVRCLSGLLPHGNRHSRLRIALTSRSDPDLEEEWQERKSLLRRVRLEAHMSELDNDIERYVVSRLETEAKLKSLSSDVRAHVKNALHGKARGMFRWAQCQMDAISSMRTAKAIKGALESLPEGLNDTYSRILLGVPNADRAIFRKILLWLCYAVSTLSLEELGEAIAIELDTDAIDEDARLTDPRDILAIGKSLVSLSGRHHGGGRLRLAHLSVRDYLASPELRAEQPQLAFFAMDPDQAHRELALACLTYLSFKEFSAGPACNQAGFADREARYPLLWYASRAFAYHMRELRTKDEQLHARIRHFFGDRSSGRLASWVQVLQEGSFFGASGEMELPPGAALYYAASFGLVDVAKAIVDAHKGECIAAEDEDKGRHETKASSRAEAKSRLTAFLDLPGGRYDGAALHAATWRRHLAVAKLLLDEGASVNVKNALGETPLDLTIMIEDIPEVSEIAHLLKQRGGVALRRPVRPGYGGLATYCRS